MKTFWRLMAAYQPYSGWLLVSVGLNFIVAMTTIYPAWIMKSVVNDVLLESQKDQSTNMLHIIAVSLVIVMAVKGVANFSQCYLMTWVSQRILTQLRTDCFKHLQCLPLNYFETQRTGQLMSRITADVQMLRHMLNSTTTILGDFIAFLGFTSYIVWLHWRLALVSLVIIPFIGALINKLSRKMKKVGVRVQDRVGDIATVLQEFITGIKVVKSFTLEKVQQERFEVANQGNFKETMKGATLDAATTPVIEFINTLGLAIIFWYGGYEVIHGRLNAGELISFLVALVGLFTPIKNLSKVSNVISQSLGAADRVYEILDAPITIRSRENATELTKCAGKVEFDHVSFAYNPGETVLKEIRLIVEPGEVVALVGPSGSGKSTFVNLIPRFYDVCTGVVRLDGLDVRDITLRSLRQHIGVVPQETVLFAGTIAENIRFGRLDADDAAVKHAAELANAAGFIEALPDKYNTMLGERGVNLSGGQRQRLALARAFLKDPRVLILDEATSALDSESENLIRDSLAQLMMNRTTFIIAHRLSTVINADKIIVLTDGAIVEWGTHAGLLNQKGIYANIFTAQFEQGLRTYQEASATS